uniref:Uncharacterized protein n=1 Tax=Anguilla anguilla TaxID=7936 RepID=A0A0E9PGD6_ANGAN
MSVLHYTQVHLFLFNFITYICLHHVSIYNNKKEVKSVFMGCLISSPSDRCHHKIECC